MKIKKFRVRRPRPAMARFFLIVFVVCCGIFSVADPNTDGPLLFGPEFTFWVGLDSSEKERIKQAVLKRMENHLVENQPEGAKFTRRGDELFSPNGWGFYVKADPGVLEVTFQPMTAEAFAKYSDDMQDAVFTSMANEGAFPALFGGGGHINLDGDYFRKRPLLLHNFIVDLLNHNELFLGIFNYDTNNALPLDLVAEDVRAKLEQTLDWLKLELNHPDAVANFLRNWGSCFDGQTVEPYWFFWHSNHHRVMKYHSIYFGNMAEASARIELRGVRPQASMDVWVRQIRLLAKRVQHLESIQVPLEVNPRVKIIGAGQNQDTVTHETAMNPPVDPQEALQNFYTYVIESGEDWADHRDYIWPAWITNGELEKFERGLQSACTDLLGMDGEGI